MDLGYPARGEGGAARLVPGPEARGGSAGDAGREGGIRSHLHPGRPVVAAWQEKTGTHKPVPDCVHMCVCVHTRLVAGSGLVHLTPGCSCHHHPVGPVWHHHALQRGPGHTAMGCGGLGPPQAQDDGGRPADREACDLREEGV